MIRNGERDRLDPRGSNRNKSEDMRRTARVPRDSRAVENLLDFVEGGHTLAEFLEEFPSVIREATISALEHAKALVIARAINFFWWKRTALAVRK